MKKAKKILTLVCCAVLLVCISVGATLAYLYSNSDPVTNTFTVGDIKIKLDEAALKEYDATNNRYEADASKDRVAENSYKIRPGIEMAKDPTVWVKDESEAAYIRMFVEITNIENVKKALGEAFLPQDVVSGWDDEKWLTTKKVEITENGSAIYEFRYYQIVNGVEFDDDDTTVDKDTNGNDVYEDLEPLFKKITIPDTLTGTELAYLQDVRVIVTAEAMQADGFATAEAAWAAFDQAGYNS